jgi:hypothetical protein
LFYFYFAFQTYLVRASAAVDDLKEASCNIRARTALRAAEALASRFTVSSGAERDWYAVGGNLACATTKVTEVVVARDYVVDRSLSNRKVSRL